MNSSYFLQNYIHAKDSYLTKEEYYIGKQHGEYMIFYREAHILDYKRIYTGLQSDTIGSRVMLM